MSVTLSRACCRWLNALKYHNSNSVLEAIDVKELVIWLEETKIRLLNIKEREGLRCIQSEHHKEWVKNLIKYLQALGLRFDNVLKCDAKGNFSIDCAVSKWDANEEFRHEVVHRLVALAIEDDYLDLVENKQLRCVVEDAPDSNTQNIIDNQLKDNLNDEAAAIVDNCLPITNMILQRFNLPVLPPNASIFMMSSALQAVQKCAQSVCTDVVNDTDDENWGQKIQLQLPIGLSLKQQDSSLKDCIAILRLLHVDDLKDLQNKINATIMQLQSITGDPKTDIKRGRVGR